MKARRFLQVAAGAAALAAAFHAQAVGVGVRAGTTGLGADLAWSVAPALALRVGYSGASWSRDVSTDGARYDSKLRLRNLSGLLDFSPLGPFRLTGGLVWNNNSYDLRGDPGGGTYRFGGNTYAAGDVGDLRGSVTPRRRLATYFGIGYGNVAGAGVNFYADLGVILQGTPRARLTATCGPALGAAACTQLQNDLAAEQVRVQEKLKSFSYYPVLNLGVTIVF